MAIVPRLDIEIDIPRMNYTGNFETLPETATIGDVAYHQGSHLVYMDGSWVELSSIISSGGNLVDDLMEVLDRYKNNSLAKDILDLIETYKVCGYE